VANESDIVHCHNKSKNKALGKWILNDIKKVVVLATSLQLITKTTLA
jgi:hypothetical protein